MGKKIDLTGKKIGKLVVNKEAYRKNKKIYWECLCDCGNVTYKRADQLYHGRTNSCGCLRKERALEAVKTHGLSQTRIYKIYYKILDRCNKESDPAYKDYGERGIKNEFESFDHFYEWSMNNGYNEELTIDRIDNDGNYSPFNCRWTTNVEQQHNKRNTRWITFEGKTQSLAKWAEEYSIPSYTLTDRLNRGWILEDALTLPLMKRGTVYKRRDACL